MDRINVKYSVKVDQRHVSLLSTCKPTLYSGGNILLSRCFQRAKDIL